MSHFSDERLVARMAAGDEGALLALHARYAPHIAALVRRMVGRKGAQGVVEDVFVRAWEGAGAFEPSQGSARAWLVMTAHRAALGRVRGASAPLALAGAHPLTARAHGASETNQSETNLAVGGTGDRPGEKEHVKALALLERAFYEGRSLEELAAETGDSPAAVGAALRAALHKLKLEAQAAEVDRNDPENQQDAQGGEAQ